MWERTLKDWTGQVRAVVKPAYGDGAEIIDFTNNKNGKPVRIETSLGENYKNPVQIMEYDELGNLVRSGMDIDQPAGLTLASMDRITDAVRNYVKDNGEWYEQQIQILYPYDNSAAALTNSISKTRLTGLGSLTSGLGLLTSEAVAIDRFGNETVQKRYVDHANRKVTQLVDIPASTQDVVQVSVNGLLEQKTDDRGQTTEFEYDALERRTEQRSDSDGGSRSVATTTHYNDLGQIAWTMDAASNKTWFAYHPDSGRKSAETNALGDVTLYTYNDRGQVKTVGGSAQYPVEYDYDEWGRMTDLYTMRSVSNGWDHTQWKYDDATGVVTNKLYDDGNGPSYTYTPDGKVETRTWARTAGVSPALPLTTTYSYDALGSLTNTVYSDGTTPSVSIAYNRLGQKTQVIDASGTNTFEYSDTLLLTNETQLATFDLARSYDELGRPIGYELRTAGVPPAALQSVSYGYDTLGRFSAVTSSVPGTADTVFDYDYLQGSSLISGYTSTAGVSPALSVSYGFEDHRDVKTEVLNEFGTSLVSSFDYTYDELMRRTKRIDTFGGTGSTLSTNDFGYNARSELTDADMGSDLYDYNYDLIGNRIQMTEDGSQTTDYAANSLNQYTSITNGGAGSPSTLLYDLDGNLTNDAVNAYTWNGENRLIAVEPISPTNNANRLEFSYDAYGRRISKDVYAWDSQVSSFEFQVSHGFVYDRWNLIAEIETNPQSEIVNRQCYTWGLDIAEQSSGLDRGTSPGTKAGGVGGLLSVVQGGASSPNEPFFPTYDANGNIAEYVSTNGTIAAHFEYDPYGNIVTTEGTEAQSFAFRFSTKYFDSETGLSYYGFRYYNPEQGRWLNRDPIGERGGMNLYGFVFNKPLNKTDFLGLEEIDCGCDENGKKIVAKEDDFGGNCCPKDMITITVWTAPSGSSGTGSGSSGGKSVGHTFLHHPNVGYRGNYPSGYEDESSHGHPNKNDKQSKKLKACPDNASEIEEDMRNREQAGSNYGLWPGGRPNCTEAACEILNDAGYNAPDEWTPDGLHNAMQ